MVTTTLLSITVILIGILMGNSGVIAVGAGIFVGALWTTKLGKKREV